MNKFMQKLILIICIITVFVYQLKYLNFNFYRQYYILKRLVTDVVQCAIHRQSTPQLGSTPNDFKSIPGSRYRPLADPCTRPRVVNQCDCLNVLHHKDQNKQLFIFRCTIRMTFLARGEKQMAGTIFSSGIKLINK